MNVVLDDQFVKRVLVQTPLWLVDFVGDGTVYTTPRWKRRLRNALEHPGNGMLSHDVVRLDVPELFRRLDDVALTPAVARDLAESVGELAALPPLWREAIVGAVVTESILIVSTIQITDRNRARIDPALELLRVQMIARDP